MTGLSSGKLSISSATSFILSAEATDEPPNFMTHVNCFSFSPKLGFSNWVVLSITFTTPLASQLTLKTLLLQDCFLAIVHHPLSLEDTEVEKWRRRDDAGGCCRDFHEEAPQYCNAVSILIKELNLAYSYYCDKGFSTNLNQNAIVSSDLGILFLKVSDKQKQQSFSAAQPAKNTTNTTRASSKQGLKNKHINQNAAFLFI